MSHSTTIISRSFSSILSQVNRIKSQYAYKRNTFLFCLSSPSNSSELSALVDALVTFSPSTVGCLSAPLTPGYISCSVAILNPDNAIPFRSIIPGKEQTQVGRWHAFRKKNEDMAKQEAETLSLPEGTVDWDKLWKTNSKRKGKGLPDELMSLNPGHVSSVLYLSDLSPEGLSSAISESFPGASQLGLLASSTPFITGRPVTLFHNSQIHDTGAVGVALTNPRCLEFQLPDDIEPLGELLDVTDSEGNLINTLNLSNPTQLLLSCIRAAGIDTTSSSAITFKDDMQFYVGVLSPANADLNQNIYQLHSITAGDPSRGTLSLNTQSMAPPVGSRVRFYYRRSVKPSSSLMMWKNACARSSLPLEAIGFTTLVADEGDDQGSSISGGIAEDSELMLENRFIAGSENGFVLGRTGESPWSCTVPGCLSRL